MSNKRFEFLKTGKLKLLLLLTIIYCFCICPVLNAENQKVGTANANTGKYKIISSPYPPFNYYKGDEIVGLSVDIMREVLQEIGWEHVEMELMEWDKAYKTALEEENIIVLSIVRNPKREKEFKWVGPIAVNYINMYSLAEIEGKAVDYMISALEDAKKYSVGVELDSSTAEYLESRNFKYLNYSKGIQKVVENLLNFKTQLIAGSKVVIYHILREKWLVADTVRKVYPIEHVNLYIAFNKNAPDKTVDKIQNALDRVKRTGRYQEIVSKYYKEKSNGLRNL
ncbi:MAG: transporter substrate-binding domain-containing protein [Victivallales bacterium]|nr:transporter substrate-binding domain-containing protein [Victivallales bacterium]MCF7888534.1 transporter substrate-binding domain-containing protein [Victivallales bacterium]